MMDIFNFTNSKQKIIKCFVWCLYKINQNATLCFVSIKREGDNFLQPQILVNVDTKITEKPDKWQLEVKGSLNQMIPF